MTNINPKTGIRYGTIYGRLSPLLLTDIFEHGKIINENKDCPDYSYRDSEGNEFMVSYLGSAPLIWCLKTDKIVKARLCSPCVPNAGNLSELDDEYGEKCYGVPDKYKEGVEWSSK